MPDTQNDGSAGYSGKPLIARLGWKPGSASIAIAPPDTYAALIDSAPIATAAEAPPSGSFAFIHLFVHDAAELDTALPLLEPRLADGGVLWVSWPKKTSGLFKDLTEDGIRAVALPMGLVDVKVCAVDEDWSGLKLMRRKAG
ncbi:MAG: DUF3052 domain-containing protein [Alphaproteobacteria bacterium]|nr:DUF3052 domain-containing protein [Alphaproteobacteria bacterium]